MRVEEREGRMRVEGREGRGVRVEEREERRGEGGGEEG